MFTIPKFEELISRSTLRFRKVKLELAFQETKEDDYFKAKPLTYLVLITHVIIVTLNLIRALTQPYSTEGPSVYLLTFLRLSYYIGDIFELSICITQRLTCLRGVFLCLTSFLVTTVYNSLVETAPIFRPGYLP